MAKLLLSMVSILKKYLTQGIEEYINKDNKPWHMPGHKRKNISFVTDDKNTQVSQTAAINPDRISVDAVLNYAMSMDLTEVDGTDDLHHPESIIKESQEELARVYGTFASYYLVNGSTCGILSAIAACYDDTDKRRIIVADNCHKSVYNAVQLLKLEPVFVTPEPVGYDDFWFKDNVKVPDIEGFICPEKLKSICEQFDNISAMVLSSPNYYGVVSDIAAISKILKSYGIKLIVDEAHGAHLPFMSNNLYIPKSAIYLGADIVVQSLHKTLPALTQTAILHVMDKALDKAVKKYKSIFMSSSPSYVLMTSMENAVVWACENDYSEYISNLLQFRKRVSKLKNIHILEKKDIKGSATFYYDATRIVLWATDRDNRNINGELLATLLSDYGNIVCEMSGIDSVVLISTPCDSSEDFKQLADTLCSLDENIEGLEEYDIVDDNLAKVHFDNHAVYDKTVILDKLNQLVDKPVPDNIYVYPPGSYILLSGEILTHEKRDLLVKYIEAGKKLRGLEQNL